ncbi:Hypothetical predicted protein [Paramuricea clavata]|uniref:Uncharacterized protein n=1 Tax=Paramuricea clavata TaxID=317549 RepID=A0A6S7K2Q5_PARCT|nr:Hypothetical predicted protein [Paramuricea clavata]
MYWGSNCGDEFRIRTKSCGHTPGLISSRVGEYDTDDSVDQLLEDLERLLATVRLLKTRYQDRHVESNTSSDIESPHRSCPVHYLGHACRPRLVVDKVVVQQLPEESMKWVDIARILGISPKTLIRRRREFEMPIGADAFTCLEDGNLDGHVREILRINPEAGLRLVEGGLREKKLKIQQNRVRESIARVNPVLSAVRGHSFKIVR